jgi:hypothetical protein
MVGGFEDEVLAQAGGLGRGASVREPLTRRASPLLDLTGLATGKNRMGTRVPPKKGIP